MRLLLISLALLFFVGCTKNNKELTTEEYFNKFKTEVMLDLNSRLEELNFKRINIILEKYKNINDVDLKSFKDKLKVKKEEVNKLRSKKILEELRVLPASKFEENYLLYKELVEIHPNNKKYIKKMNHYKKKKDEKEAKIALKKKKEEIKLALKKSFYGDKPIQNSWDGSYYPVKRYLRNAMHNPDSLDFKGCTKVYELENKGWLVGCQFRGDNAFGATVLNAKWFTIRQGRVVNVESSNAYKW